MVKDDVLKYLENSIGTVVSGGELSKILNVSRTAVWKSINILKNLGYEIESISNEGYRLNINNNILSENIITSKLKTKVLGSKFEILKVVDSTNNYIKTQAQTQQGEGLVVISEAQTLGKGRMGKKFISLPRAGIYMSILLRPNMKITDINIITIVAAISVVKAIENKTGVKPVIKWVNDILYNHKKLCGILTEASIESECGHVDYVVVGMGVNTIPFQPDFPHELKNIITSVEEITGRYCDRNELIAEILNQFEIYYFELTLENKKNDIVNIYRQNLDMLGAKIEVLQGSTHYYAKAVDIDENAELIIEDENGEIKIINSGEISIRKA